MNDLPITTFRKRGMLYGLLGTLLMSLIMLVGMGTGISPIPEPIPLAIAKSVLGDIAKPLLMLFAIITHFGYGAFWGAVLFSWLKTNGNIWHGLGWGVFGSPITPKIAVATLALHLIYGGTLGWGLTKF